MPLVSSKTLLRKYVIHVFSIYFVNFCFHDNDTVMGDQYIGVYDMTYLNTYPNGRGKVRNKIHL